MPRYTGSEARWESFRRWLIRRLETLRSDEYVILTAAERGFLQFMNEGGNLLGECSDPAVFLGTPATPGYTKAVLEAGWGAKEEGGNSPNFRAQWFPTYIPAMDDDEPWTPDLEDAVDAADLAVQTLREAFGVTDPKTLDVDGGRTMTVSALDAELGTLFPGEDDDPA